MRLENHSQNPISAPENAAPLLPTGKPKEAVAPHQELLNPDLQDPEQLANLGATAMQSGNFEEGVRLIGQSLAIAPHQPQAILNFGVGLRELGQRELALASYDCLIALEPGNAKAYCCRGDVLHDLRRFAEALASHDHAIALNPDYAEAHFNRGNALLELGRLEEALACYEHTISLDPAFALAYNNRGIILRKLFKLDAARESYNRALELQPDLLPALRNKSALELLTGNYKTGWALNESRFKQKNQFLENASQPLWLGEPSIAGKTILIYPEQGLGDFILFCRYVPMIESLGAKVILIAPPSLMTLAKTLKGNFTLVAQDQPLPDFDFHCPLMSLPLAFKTTLETIPAGVPYLLADGVKTASWQDQMGPRSKLRVGLVWSSGVRPDLPMLLTENSRRNIKLSMFAGFRHLDVAFYSLQKGQPAESELHELVSAHWDGPDILDFTAQLNDFSDTAALIANLDLVISVDTSTAHLAAALGKAVWVLSRADACWRWMLERSDSPWYPTATVFRQPAMGDWESVLSEVANKLETYTTTTRHP